MLDKFEHEFASSSSNEKPKMQVIILLLPPIETGKLLQGKKIKKPRGGSHR